MFNSISTKWLPDKNKLRAQYDSLQVLFSYIISEVEAKLKNILVLPSSPTYKTRIKSFNSYYRKLLRVRPTLVAETVLPILNDIVGIRVIVPFLQDLAAIEKQITEHFSVVEIEHKGAERTFKEFGYESTHILISLDKNMLEEHKLPLNMVCEIQVRTILQDAWAEVEHELVYKAEFSPFDLPLKRKLASMNASLSLADIIFQEIRDYQNKLNYELEQRRSMFYEAADQISRQNLIEVFKDDTSPIQEVHSSPYVHGTIDDLLLEAIHAHNIGELERSIAIYTQIIALKNDPIARSVMYKHRGDAYFSQGNYEHALSDYLCGIEHNPDSFRLYYLVGIVYSTINNDEHALPYYDLSLEKNEFQPYVYYRKALSQYLLGDYVNSLADLDKSVTLGLQNREDERKLRINLAKKLGIT